jgi:hypothetical protein
MAPFRAQSVMFSSRKGTFDPVLEGHLKSIEERYDALGARLADAASSRFNHEASERACSLLYSSH